MSKHEPRMIERYEVTTYRVWEHDSGHTASVSGACPWFTEAESFQWTMVTRGWTIRDNLTNTTGQGHKPFNTLNAATAEAAQLNQMQATKNIIH